MPPDNLETRVSALETRVHQLTVRVRASEHHAAAARVLAGAADRDLTEFPGELRDFPQATTASFTAVHEDLTDLRTHLDNGFIEIRGKHDATATGQQHIVELLEQITTDQGRYHRE